MNEELLQALEEAHANGYDLNWAKKFAIDNNGADLIPQIEDFYKKKKRPGTEVGPSVSSDLPLESPFPAPSRDATSINPNIIDVDSWNKNARELGFVPGSLIPKANEDTWLIADDNPNELQRLWNRAVARGRLGSLVADYETTGLINPEEIAYYNNILQRDAPKDEDWLSANIDEHPMGSFLLDIIRVLPESMIAAGAAGDVGIIGAGAGAAAGSPFAGVGALPGAVAGFFGTTSLATEYAGKLMSSLQEAGVDITSPEDINRVLLAETQEDLERLKKAESEALARGLPIGIIDAVAAGVGGRIMKAATRAGASMPKALLKEAALQGTLGGGGELTGQILSGEDISVRDIALEAFAELGPALPGVAYNLAKEKSMTAEEKSYATWVENQDQNEAAATVPIAMAADNGRIASIDRELRDLEKRVREEQDPVVKKATREAIVELRKQKYGSLLEVQQQLMGLSPEARNEASGLTQEILAGASAINKGGLSAAEQSAVEAQMQRNEQRLNEIINQERQRRDTERGQQVPGGEQVGEEPGAVSDIEAGQGTTQIGGILQAREAEQEVSSNTKWGLPVPQTGKRSAAAISKGLKAARAGFKKGQFLNLFDPFDVSIYREEMDKMGPGMRAMMDKLVLASEAYRKLNPEATHFNIGFSSRGYERAGQDMGLARGATKGSAGITAGGRGGRQIGKILALKLEPGKRESATGRGYRDRYTPVGTAYHEVFHNVFATYFDKNPVDYNQFRRLVIRRLRESDVNELNDFADRYTERDDATSAGAYKSEEFMVQLGALLANKRISFDSSALEDIKAFLNGIISKLTGGKVQIFEDAGLAKDLARYMQGISQAVRTGSDISKVEMAESLQTERFRRAAPEVQFGPDGSMVGYTESQNLAGLPEPTSYEKETDSMQKLMSFINPKLDAFIAGIENKYGLRRLRSFNREILQALEISESMNLEHINRMFIALSRIRDASKKLSKEDRQRVYDLSNRYLFQEDIKTDEKGVTDVTPITKQERDAAIREIASINEDIARDLGILNAIRKQQQRMMVNSPAFDMLTEDLRNVIKENATKYGTRTYKIFTDPNFKVDADLRKAAEKVLAEAKFWEKADELQKEGPTEAMEEFFEQKGLDPDDLDSYIEFVQQDKNMRRKIIDEVNSALIALEKASAANRGKGTDLTGEASLGQLRVPTKKLKQKKDLPVELRRFLGEDVDPFAKMSQTISTLTSITAQYTLVDRINDIAQGSGLSDLIITKSIWKGLVDDKLSTAQMTDMGKQMGVIPADQSLADFMKEKDLTTMGQVRTELKRFFDENYQVIEESKSPMKGKAIKKDFVSMLKLTPMYQADNKVLQWYYDLLLQMRRVRVLYNLPTWRKNIMGGWYFLMANGVLPYNKDRGGLTIMKDLSNRFKKLKTGEVPPELQEVFQHVGNLGLLGASPNYGLLGDVNQSFYDMMTGKDAESAWSWLPAQLQSAQRELGIRQARVAYQYGFIDDYTKVIAYLSKRENFAKRLASNPEGRTYAELNDAEKQEVDEAVVERIKQNMPTMSRIHPAFRELFKLPMGDFLSFRVEAFRSFFGIYRNASFDIQEALTNKNLSESQRNAYLMDGIKALSLGTTLGIMSTMGYAAALSMLLDNDEEEELADSIRGVNYLLPAWMVGSNIIPVSMDKKGSIRFVNISSEDPYDEIFGLVYGRNGISRSDALTAIAKDFYDPNLATRMLFNLVQGKDSYGRPILDNEDVSWFNRWIIGTNLSTWSDAYGSYVFKEVFLPPNINYIAKEYRKRMKEAESNPDIELQPLETAAQLSSAVIFRDYPVDIAKQFYFNMEEENFRTPYAELTEDQKVTRKARLDEVKLAYEFASTYSAEFGNYDIISSVIRTIENKFRKSPEEMMYIIYDVELEPESQQPVE
jgi:hypothetical protein